jgi:glycosyltransferase involved in cell wall biosynthesis
MAEQPLFSVLIANYNNGCYLQEAIGSVLAQSYQNWEIIIVDDKSSDNSIEVYNRYKNDARFHVYYNDENKGVGFTKHRCVEMANGDLCGFIDPDDVLVGTDVFDTMVQAHLNHPNASMVYSGMFRADENLNIVRESPGQTIEAGCSALHTCSWPIHPFLTFKKEMYDKTEGMDCVMQRAVDYDLYYKLEEVGELVHLDCIQYIQRNNPHSISLNDNAYKAAAWHVYACVQAMKRRGLDDESLMLFPMESANRKARQKGYEKAMSSRIYRLGMIIVSPLLLLKRIWKK